MTTQENLLARRLKHRNIVAAMELPDGDSLRKVLDAGPLPIARAIRIAHDIASGLAHAHLEGAVHGSLTLSSIIVTRSGVAKITDFGAARPGGAVDHRNDVFALGALFYEMLTHRPPVAGASPRPPSELNPLVPRALDAIVLSMLAPQPADRMAGIPVLLRELQRLEEGLGLESGASPGTDEPAATGFGIRPEPSAGDAFQNRPISDSEEFDYRRAMMARESRERPSGSRNAIYSALVLVLAVLGIGIGGFMYYSSGPGKQIIAASRVQEAPAREPVAAPEPLPTKSIVTPRIPLAQSHAPAAAAAGSGLTVPPSMAQAPKEPAKKLPRAAPPAAKVPEPQPGRPAQLVLAVSPGGQIYIDGELQGTTPPTTTFDLDPGMHRIEVRSGSRKPFLTYMTVEAGDVRRIQHDFNAKPSRPPT